MFDFIRIPSFLLESNNKSPDATYSIPSIQLGKLIVN